MNVKSENADSKKTIRYLQLLPGGSSEIVYFFVRHPGINSLFI